MPSQFIYHDPPIASLLILSNYFYFLNLFGWAFEWLLSAGLLGQILIGIVWGSPLAEWLHVEWQETFVVVGYVGLLLVVFEGESGRVQKHISRLLSSPNFHSNCRRCIDLPLGPDRTTPPLDLHHPERLAYPIALSFLLTPMFSFPLLHSFVAGSALSSTSLGTVLTLLSGPSLGFDIKRSKLGTALLGAAVMDDVVAFILSEILKLVGENTESGAMALGGHIGRAIGVTFGFGLIMIPITKYLIGPGFLWFKHTRSGKWRVKAGREGMLFFMTCLFMGMIAGTRYAGTSPLYGAYIAGLVVSYLNDLDTRVDLGQDEMDMDQTEGRTRQDRDASLNRVRSPSHASNNTSHPTLIGTFEHYITPVLIYLLLPIFFGSIGYSIPFIPLWRGKNIWRGIIYAILMTFAKAFCGVWLLIWKIPGSQGSFLGGMKDRARETWKGALLLGFAMIARGEIGLL